MLRACDDPRLLAGLRHSCGPVFMDALENPEVIEIMLNPTPPCGLKNTGKTMNVSALSRPPKAA